MATDKTKVGDTPEVEAVYPLSHHLGDLRKRLMYSMGCVALMFILCYWQRKYVVAFVTQPLTSLLADFPTASLTTLKLTEGFFAEMTLALIAAFAISMRFILFHFL